MKKNSLRVYLCAPVMFALALPQVSAAQESDKNVFEEITVTATKRE
jgi:hypothetical protein